MTAPGEPTPIAPGEVAAPAMAHEAIASAPIVTREDVSRVTLPASTVTPPVLGSQVQQPMTAPVQTPPVHLPVDAEMAKMKLWMQIIVSGVMLVAALFVLMSGKYDEALVKWSIGIIGLVVGYWLR
jgi:hypothetical protein